MSGVSLQDVLEQLVQALSIGIDEMTDENESPNPDVSNELEDELSDSAIVPNAISRVATEQPIIQERDRAFPWQVEQSSEINPNQESSTDRTTMVSIIEGEETQERLPAREPSRNSASSATRQPVSGQGAFSLQFGYASATDLAPGNRVTAETESRLRQEDILRANEVAMNTRMHHHTSPIVSRGRGFGVGAPYPSIPQVTASGRFSNSSLPPTMSTHELLSLSSSPEDYRARYIQAQNIRNLDSGSGANQTPSSRQVPRRDQQHTSTLLSGIGR
ncbi:hypothetical protein IFR05_001072 [Cadophora sp. M221]|nr:hypothetical protein IFR05_001072 [Cadophora sp. M221]